MDLNALVAKLFEQSATAAVLLVGLLFFARWVRKQIQDERKDKEREREDKNRCFDLHDALRTCIENNTRSVDNQSRLIEELRSDLAGKPSRPTHAFPPRTTA